MDGRRLQIKRWRELVELAGVISVVAALLLLAWEVRQSNRLARLAQKADIHMAFDTEHRARLSDPSVARLYAKLEAPDGHLITATETSQARGLAASLVHRLDGVQAAFDQGLLTQAELDFYRDHFARQLDELPGLVPQLLHLLGEHPGDEVAQVFAPLAAYRQDAPQAMEAADQ